MNFGILSEAPCENTVPATDPRCDDPAFALAHPEACPIQPKLLIKPGIALACALGSVQFKAFIIENGKEIDVTADSLFTSNDLSVAIVGVKSGNATGLTAGTVAITAIHEGLTATAELNVLGCTGMCDSTVAMQLLIDNSLSMSQIFSPAYSKLAFAKAASEEFASTTNTQKDLIGARIFNANSTNLLEIPISDADLVANDIAGIAQSQQLTTFRDGIEGAIADLGTVTADLKVLVIVSDGEDTTSQYNDDNNPLVPIEAFKAAGGIVICFGIRAHDKGFNLLEAMSTGGFFINSYATNKDDAIDFFKGLRGYICAGNCTPAGDEITHQGISNYTGFANWDVTQGEVDLLGNGFFDVLPGNGLYVDLRGSPVLNSNFDIPILLSKDDFSLLSGHSYRIALDLAGNQCFPRAADTIRLRVYAGAVELVNQQINVSDYSQGFTTYAFNFTAPADMAVKIEISQFNDTGTDLSMTQSGILLGRVKLDDTTDLENLLDDDFDDENEVYVPPRCGIGTVYYNSAYAIGYNCYGDGCLDEPPPIQLSDPAPLPDLETGYTPPIIFTSTKTSCAVCDAGFANGPTVSLVPVMTSNTAPSGVAASSGNHNLQTEAFNAFDGYLFNAAGNPSVWTWQSDTVPCWISYQFTSAKTVTQYQITGYQPAYAPRDFTFEGSNDGVTWDVLDTRTGQSWYLAEQKRYAITTPTSYLYYRLNISALNGQAYCILAELEMFVDVAQSICKSATATSTISQSNADDQASAQALALAQAEMNCVPFFTSTQTYTAKCGHDVDIGSYGQDVTKSATRTSFISQAEADALATAAAMAEAIAELNCTLSNNDHQIAINDSASPPTAASPYPSTKYVTGQSGLVTNVTVSITGLTHFFPSDVLIILRAPSGETCRLLSNCGNAPASGVDLVFDDAAGSSLSAGAPITTGTWKPSGGAFVNLPPPGPQPTIGLTLADLINATPNGAWSLWVADDSGLGGGTIDSWDLTITSA